MMVFEYNYNIPKGSPLFKINIKIMSSANNSINLHKQSIFMKKNTSFRLKDMSIEVMFILLRLFSIATEILQSLTRKVVRGSFFSK